MDLPLVTHISGGVIALIAATWAIAVRKGGDMHKRAGRVFVGAMLVLADIQGCLLYTSPSPRDATLSRMPSSA